jgi:hypothetical protein
VSNVLSGLSATDILKALGGGLLPFVGGLVVAGVAWAKDLGWNARRIRSLDEATKRLEFWEAWRVSLVGFEALTEERKQHAIEKVLEADRPRQF